MTRSPTRRRTALAAVAALALLGAACASSDDSTDAPASTTAPAAERAGADGTTVEIRMFRFQTETLEVPAGTEVVWENRDDILHTVTGDDDASVIDGEVDGVGAEYSVTFTEPGTYSYHCEIHPVMVGEVVVTG